MFRNKIEKNCSYCLYGYILTNGSDCLCDKYGLVTEVYNCKKFKYDPLKRIPHRSPSLPDYESSEFII